MSVPRQLTPRLSDAESAAAYLCDVWGITDLARIGPGKWRMMPDDTPEIRRWGIAAEPITMTDENVIQWAQREGWRQ